MNLTLEELRDLNVELLHANLEMLRDIKDYCRRNRLPSPTLDNGLTFRVSQLLNLTQELNGESPNANTHRNHPEDEHNVSLIQKT